MNPWSLIFFFSSRRRHTRLQGDWSSDVCSSDIMSRARSPPSPTAEMVTSPESSTLISAPVCSWMPRMILPLGPIDRKSTRLNSSHLVISYAVFCLKKKKKQHNARHRKGNLYTH